jgi:flagellar basal body-associated protein FliL
MSKTAAPADPVAVADPIEETSREQRSLLLLVVAVVALLGLAAGGWLLIPRLLKPGAAPGPPPKKIEVPVKATFPLGSVIVNLDGGTKHYIKLAVDIGVPGPKDVKEVEAHKPQLLDLVIGVVSATPAEQLVSGEGRMELKKKLLERIHEELGLESVGRVYFTEFVIQ